MGGAVFFRVALKKGEEGCDSKQVGHWVQWTAAPRVNSEIADWLASTSDPIFSM